MKSHEELRLRPELRTKIIKWLKSFHHLDPRYQLLKFFNLVAKEGADQVMDSQMNSDYFSDFDFGEGADDRDQARIKEAHNSEADGANKRARARERRLQRLDKVHHARRAI